MTVVKCPNCGKETVYQGNEFRPFCSERCKLLDLGAWADEKYALPAEPASLTEEELQEMEKALNNRDKE